MPDYLPAVEISRPTGQIPAVHPVVGSPKYGYHLHSSGPGKWLMALDGAAPLSARELFRQLSDKWKAETLLFSSVSDMCMHEAYQKIIGMGPNVVPLILEELEREPNHWYWALAAITREDPAALAPAGDIEAICNAWIDWGKRTGARMFYAGIFS